MLLQMDCTRVLREMILLPRTQFGVFYIKIRAN